MAGRTWSSTPKYKTKTTQIKTRQNFYCKIDQGRALFFQCPKSNKEATYNMSAIQSQTALEQLLNRRHSPRLLKKNETIARAALWALHDALYGPYGYWTLWHQLPVAERPTARLTRHQQQLVSDWEEASARIPIDMRVQLRNEAHNRSRSQCLALGISVWA